jgi:stage V sporulation protein B
VAKKLGQGFLGGAVVLMLSVLVVKIIGALFKIPLTAMLGGVGMGYFMTAYGLWGPMYSLSAAGFAVAVSKMVSGVVAADRPGDASRTARVALLLFSAIGLLLSIGIFMGADLFAGLVGNPRAAIAVRTMAPALLFCCVSASMRGYYEGQGRMTPTAFTLALEALVKFAAGIGLAYGVLNSANTEYTTHGSVFGVVVADGQQALSEALPYAAAAAVGGVVLSTVAGAGFLLLRRLFGGGLDRQGRRAQTPYRTLAVSLLGMALPIALSSIAVNVTGVIDLISVMNRLDSAVHTGYGALMASHGGAIPAHLAKEDIAGFLYGSYTGMAMTVFNIVPAFTSAFGTSALPLLSGYQAGRRVDKLRRTVESVIRVSAMLAIPAGLGISALSRPILDFLFGNSPAEVAVSAPLLSVMGIAVIFVALTPPINSMLQAVGGVYYPVRFMLIGATLKLFSNALLVGIPALNIKGAPVGTLVCYGFTFIAGLFSLSTLTGASIRVERVFLKPLAAGLACALTARLVYDGLFALTTSTLSVLPAVAAGAGVYLLFILFSRAICREDLADMKNAEKMALLLAKHDFLG